jgi:hypothetical protein
VATFSVRRAVTATETKFSSFQVTITVRLFVTLFYILRLCKHVVNYFLWLLK